MYLDEIKEILVKDQLVNRFEYRTSDDTIIKHVCNIVDSVISDSAKLYPNEKRDIKFSSGNLTVETIQTTFRGYGLNAVSIRHNDQKSAFDNTKSNRNKLAHGNNTFKECGRDYSYNDLNKMREEIFDYLQKSIDEIDSFIANKRFTRIATIAM